MENMGLIDGSCQHSLEGDSMRQEDFLMVCVLTNERIEFCWPFLGRETERRNLSMNKGMISEGRGKLGYHNMGSL